MYRLKLIGIISAFLLISCKNQEVKNNQDFEKVVISHTDPSNLYVNDGDSTELFYLKLIPKSNPIGAVVILPSGGETIEDVLKQITLPKLAVKNNILTIIPSINWGTETREVEIKILDKIFNEVAKEHQIPKENFVLGGLSNGGIISLTYAETSTKVKNGTSVIPKGVFGIDVPLDKAHLYEYSQREIKRNFSAAGMGEANWIINNYNQIYGGSPTEFPNRYVEGSIYSNGAENGGNAKYLKDIAIRMYTDLDVKWLINERRRDLYDWNGTDIVAMINDLKIMGNDNAEVIISMEKGFRLDGTKNPHSWSIMDSADLMEWILGLFKEELQESIQ